ncbi:Glycosyltransferase involved in cell wall bisynthesis [Chryseobacterium carnipullorum]|uniref:glycosyltransferase family A protein n=1 Tax=Chryseobacterium carnipullorum TaxID=1124835 RepID=UPI00091BCCFA|nr:glycosyltransferase family 2 protein [Chryseobacterium carnipullorum]SHM64016.1 Glycosyltransferase involved in cell wall bisynthesis [Chryseobacterium carnipullorum]
MLITIFTPTYNRSHLLERLYSSLCNQSFTKFEWLIVDDGSKDDTEIIVEKFINENKISIRYYKQINSGKHIAINKGVDLAIGELFFIVDSDDKLPENSLQIINERYLPLRNDYTIAGVSGRKAYFDYNIIGNKMDKDLICNSFDFRFKFKMNGDMSEVFRTSVLKEYKFPVTKEKFCPEALVFNRIGQDCKFLWFEDITYLVEYLNDGLTARTFDIRKNSPINSTLYYMELSKFNIPFVQKCKAIINYWRFSIYNKKDNLKSKISKINAFISFLLLPFIVGIILYDHYSRK